FHQRVGLLPRLLRRHIDGDNIFAALQQGFEYRFAERLLAVDHDTHSISSNTFPLMPAKAGIQFFSCGLGSPLSRGRAALKTYAASALAPFSDGVIAPELLISATSLAE